MLANNLLNCKKAFALINGPISKKNFLKTKFLGITEYLAKMNKSKNYAMLIYNKKLSVCPITTHLPLKFVTKKINKNLIIKKIKLIYNFYRYNLSINPKITKNNVPPIDQIRAPVIKPYCQSPKK